MYIHPILVGVLACLGAEILTVVVCAIVKMKKGK